MAMRGKKSGVTFDDARELAAALPGVEVSTMYGAPALKVKGKFFACLPSHQPAEPRSIVVRLEFERRDEMVAAAPEKYYFTEHYAGYPSVLARMDRIDKDELSDLLRMAHRFVTRASGPASVRRGSTER